MNRARCWVFLITTALLIGPSEQQTFPSNRNILTVDDLNAIFYTPITQVTLYLSDAGGGFYWRVSNCPYIVDGNGVLTNYVQSSVNSDACSTPLYTFVQSNPSTFLGVFGVENCCFIGVFDCPPVAAGYFVTACYASSVGATSPLVTLGACTTPLPLNCIYGLQVTDTPTCAVQVCPYASQAIPPSLAYAGSNIPYFAPSVTTVGSCSACPAIPAKAYLINNTAFPCSWTCGIGMYTPTASASSTCTPCSAPSNAVYLASLTLSRVLVIPSSIGQGACAFICPAGTFLNTTTNLCVNCANGTYGSSSSANNWQPITACQPCVVPSPYNTQCKAGYYMVMDKTSCQVPLGCTQCTNGMPGQTYYVLLANGSSANPSIPNACYVGQCLLAYSAGYQTNPECGVANASNPSPNPVACTSFPIWDGKTTVPLSSLAFYYTLNANGVSNCSFMPCTVCTAVTGYYNALCPTANSLTITAGDCSAKCIATTLPSNAQWSFPWKYTIANQAQCPFVCNTGFYAIQRNPGSNSSSLNSTVCIACPDSQNCPVGKYMDNCSSRTCWPCPSNLGPAHSIFTPSIAGYGNQSCAWACISGYYNNGLDQCMACIPLQCNTTNTMYSIGFYPLVNCPQGGVNAPSCAVCMVPPNSIATGSSSLTNQPYSCPFTCNTGYYCKKQTGNNNNNNAAWPCMCASWTLNGTCTVAGQYWGGANALQDNSCILCPNLPNPYPQLNMTSKVIWGYAATQCMWMCSAGGYYVSAAPNCLACPAGSYTSSNSLAVTCQACAPGTYQNSVGGTTCFLVPNNSMSSSDFSSFVCNAGYKPQTVYSGVIPLPSIGCGFCAPSYSNLSSLFGAMNMASATFVSGTCALSAFSCLGGFYRSTSSISSNLLSGGACLPCPSYPGVVAVPTTSSVGAMAAVTVCGTYPSCPYPSDEQLLACPPWVASGSGACLPGFYAMTSPNGFSTLSRVSTVCTCVQCSNMQCIGASQSNLPCTNGATVNSCGSCAFLPGIGQAWYAPGLSCALACVAGYSVVALGNSSSPLLCGACSAGKYQSSAGVTSLITGAPGSCTGCSSGTYAPTQASSACMACPAGTFSALPMNSSSCLLCAPGTYSNKSSSTSNGNGVSGVGGNTGVSTCTLCTNGSFASTAGLSMCQSCPAQTPVSNGTSCASPSPSGVGGAICPAGFYQSSSTVCAICPAGAYCLGGAFPLPCPFGQAPSPPLATSVAQCNQSVIGYGATSSQQATSSIIMLRTTSSYAPVACPNGTTTAGLSGATSSAWCASRAGYYGFPPGGFAAQLCPMDSYCAAGSLVPTQCPASTPYNSILGAVLVANCSNTMLPPCRAGYYQPFGTTGLLQSCLLCPVGCYCPGNGTSTSGTTITTIAPPSIYACDVSSTGNWFSSAGASAYTQCIKSQIVPQSSLSCPAGTQTMSSTLTSIVQCRADVGFYYIPGTQSGLACPTNYYCPAQSLQPIPCVLSVCTQIGYSTAPITVQCAGGQGTQLSACVSCAPPALPANAQYVAVGNCSFCCNAGYVKQSSTGSTTQCTPAANSFSCTASAGMYRPATNPCNSITPACQNCPSTASALLSSIITGSQTSAANSSSSGGSSSSSIISVPLAIISALGWASAAPGWLPIGLSTMTGIGSCVYTCAPGYCFGTSGVTTPAGGGPFYFALNASINNNNNASSANVQVPNSWSCQIAMPGYVSMPGGVCLPCPAGTYLYESGGSACRTCPASSTSSLGSATCTCAPGSVAIPSLSTDALGASITVFTCSVCPNGTGWSKSNGCVPCPPGTTCIPDENPWLPVQCPAGFFRASAAFTCTPCPPGTISSTVEATTCVACPQGTYANASSRTACALCPNGTMGIQSGLAQMSQCTPCPMRGQFTSSSGTVCMCAAGLFADPVTQACIPCNARCSVANAFVALPWSLPASSSTTTTIMTPPVPWLKPGCTQAGTGSGDFVCACNKGFAGDGITACTPCSNASTCVCPSGSYYVQATNLCVACRSCPLLAVATLTSCQFGTVGADTTTCECPALYYYSSAANQCFPCTQCSPPAKTITVSTCAAGAQSDTTICVCRANFTGNGFVCN